MGCLYVSCSYTIHSRVSIFARIVDHYVILQVISISHLDAKTIWLYLDPIQALILHKTIHFSNLTLFATWVFHMSISTILFIVESHFCLGSSSLCVTDTERIILCDFSRESASAMHESRFFDISTMQDRNILF